MRECVRAHDGLVRLYHEPGDLRHDPRGRHDLGGVDAGFEPEEILTRAHSHHDLFQRCVAGALAQTIDRTFHLPRPADHYGRERVRHRHAKVVMAVHRPDRLVGVGDPFAQVADELAELLRHGVSDRIRHVDRRGAFRNHCFDHAAEEIGIGPAAILGREFDVAAMLAGKADRELGLFVDLVPGHAQLFFHVQVAGREENVEPRRLGACKRVQPALDVLVVCTTEARHDRILDDRRHGLDGLEVAVGRRRKARLDHIHPHALQGTSDTQLLFARHRGAGTLFAVAHGRVENDQLVFFHGCSSCVRQTG